MHATAQAVRCILQVVPKVCKVMDLFGCGRGGGGGFLGFDIKRSTFMIHNLQQPVAVCLWVCGIDVKVDCWVRPAYSE